ncbi:hypothetical protein RhiirA1_425416 [Rhizophagus irregularis]|uniref:Uncharacterized protein n=1 Tax=Rhizophagus irregularis TaxID=588596 RepID=A0A2N0RC72_9GLOM|nr:hypothetical protein RhiirA1_425416 [Rhizophagus irregularis]
MDILYLLDKKRNIIGFLDAMDQHSTFSIMITLYIFEGQIQSQQSQFPVFSIVDKIT